jgi:hypothetical protein
MEPRSQRKTHPWQPRSGYHGALLRFMPGVLPVLYSGRETGGFRSSFSPARSQMNVVEGLQAIRGRLVENEADPATIAAVDMFLKRAALPAAQNAAAASQLQLVRMLMRTPASNTNVQIYNDLVRLEEELQSAAAHAHAAREAEEAKPIPKTKKYYKELKEKGKKKG